ncbi:MAG: hypothetical protein JWN87_1646 [Frankiales bacterium]|nr:hypothetical protein [Frankiales bacterium]
MVAKTRLSLLLAAGTALAVAAPLLTTPAFADPALVGVTFTTTDGARQFKVTKVDGTTALSSFSFGSDMTQPFRTTVADTNRMVNSSGYQVNATMTNLYLKTANGYDYTTFIPASAMSLQYGSNPLAGTATLPVKPKVVLSGAAGALGTCADSSTAGLLGLLAPLGGVLDLLGLNLLSPTLKSVCTQLFNVAGTPINTVLPLVDQVLSGVPLGLGELPFALSGAQQGGTFDNPSFQGPIASLDPAKNATAATSKRIMGGAPLVGGTLDPSALLTKLTSTLQGVLTGPTTGLPIVGSTVKLALTQAESALSSTLPGLTSALAGLTSGQQLGLLSKLTATLQSVVPLDLSTVTGSYDAFPILAAAPSVSKAGTYEGTMVVDFFES